MADVRILPSWAEDLRRRYLRNEAVLFVLHGNVHDLVLVDGALKPLTEFLTEVFWKDVRDTIAVYNLATGVRFAKKAKEAEALLPHTFKKLDKAAKRHVIHRNTASNHKSKLAKAVASAVKKAK